MADEESAGLKWELLVADTWDDPDLKQRLLSDPAGVCAERGILPPEGVSINVVEDTDDTMHLVLPMAPSEEELSEEELENVAGGGHFHISLSGGGGFGGGFGGCGGGFGGCGHCGFGCHHSHFGCGRCRRCRGGGRRCRGRRCRP